MNFYERRILPHVLNFVMRQSFLETYREEVVDEARGRVLEIGLGSGLNLPFYSKAVESITGIEPSASLLRMATQQVVRAKAPVELLQASADDLPIESGSIDTVVTTWSLCTIPDAARALREARRVLKPDGMLRFVEHGRAPEPNIARWQNRLDPIWGKIAGGCHLNRPIDLLIESAGFKIEHLQHDRMAGPPTHNYLYLGSARP